MRTLLFVFLSMLSMSTLAHTGHDHGHWLSQPIHFLTLLAVASIVAIAAFVVKRTLAAKK